MPQQDNKLSLEKQEAFMKMSKEEKIAFILRDTANEQSESGLSEYELYRHQYKEIEERNFAFFYKSFIRRFGMDAFNAPFNKRMLEWFEENYYAPVRKLKHKGDPFSAL